MKFGFKSIKNRILLFAVIVTVVPSFGIGLLLHSTLETTLTQKIEQQFLDSSNIIQRELTLWLKERSYDLYVFSNSFVIAENFSNSIITDNQSGDLLTQSNKRAVETYLSSVEQEFDDYQRLFIFSPDGKIAASSSSDFGAEVNFPANAEQQVKESKYLKGDVYYADNSSHPLMLIGVPLFARQSTSQVGYLVIEVQLKTILTVLKNVITESTRDRNIYGGLVQLKDGLYFFSSNTPGIEQAVNRSNPEILKHFHQGSELQEFTNDQNKVVIGLLREIDELGWGLIVAASRADVFSEVNQTRNRNILIICVLALIIGALAYYFARQIIIPLKALTEGALKVSEGDLDVTLSVHRENELGLATIVFNQMVENLRESQSKLEQMATTDTLTKLVNRKQVLTELNRQLDHYKRYSTEFSILMVDVDHFKNVNDTYGHLTGDDVLSGVAAIFKDIIRTVDVAGRYGGEEFLLVLSDSGREDAEQVAERIRFTINNHTFQTEGKPLHVTVSIGVTTVVSGDKDDYVIINRADQALYQAKNSGRNQVVFNAGTESAVSGQQGKIISLKRAGE